MTLAFPPFLPGGAFTAIPIQDAVAAMVTRKLGDGWQDVTWRLKSAKTGADPAEGRELAEPRRYVPVANAIKETQQGLLATLAAGKIKAFARPVSGDIFYAIPAEYWTEFEHWALSTLAGKLHSYGPFYPLPPFLEDATVFVMSDDLKLWLGDTGKRRGPKLLYDAPRFKKQAEWHLAEEGGFSEDFRESDLLHLMRSWCDEHWQRSPGDTWMRGQIREAETDWRSALPPVGK